VRREQAKDFIKRLLVVDAGARMSMAEALQHPWLAHATLAPIPSSIGESAGL
jgi:serine/threonine protein kinase